jgi:hypothetical protein
MWIQGLLAVIQVLPSLVEAVGKLTKDAEAISPVGGGAAQKQAVVGLVKAGVEAADKFDKDGELMSEKQKEAIVGIAGEATDLMVGLYNATGTFKKGP